MSVKRITKIVKNVSNKEVKVDKFIEKQVQLLVNKFADSRIKLDDVYVRFDTGKPDFFNKVVIIKDVLDTEQFRIIAGVYRTIDNKGYKRTYSGMGKNDLIRYLTSTQGLKEIKKDLGELLNKVVYMVD